MNFVISLKNALSRREHITEEFHKQNIPFQFFDAVNIDNYQTYQKKFSIDFNSENFTKGEKACFLSHVALWDYCVKNNLNFIAVFEDDVLLSNNAASFLKKIDWIPSDVEIVKLEKFENKVLMSLNRKKLKLNTHLRLLSEKHLGAAGYIISNKAAKKLLDQVSHDTIEDPVDELIFNKNIYSKFLRVYQFLPGLVMQSDRIGLNKFTSQLEEERSKKNIQIIKLKRNLSQKIFHELKRIIYQFFKLFCNIDFKN